MVLQTASAAVGRAAGAERPRRPRDDPAHLAQQLRLAPHAAARRRRRAPMSDAGQRAARAAATSASTQRRRTPRTAAHMPSAAWNAPAIARTKTIGETPRARRREHGQVRTPRARSRSRSDAATPTTPHWSADGERRPRGAAHMTIEKRKIVSPRPRAIRMSTLQALQRLDDADPRQHLDDRDRRVPLVAEHDGTKSGATTIEARERGHRDRGQDPAHARPGGRDPLRLVLDARERGREHALQRPAEPGGGLDDRVVGDRVGAERRRAEEAADQEAVAVRLQVEEHPVAEHVGAEAAERRAGSRARTRSAAARASGSRPGSWSPSRWRAAGR